jgi:hypothetical protein
MTRKKLIPFGFEEGEQYVSIVLCLSTFFEGDPQGPERIG